MQEPYTDLFKENVCNFYPHTCRNTPERVNEIQIKKLKKTKKNNVDCEAMRTRIALKLGRLLSFKIPIEGGLL